jgi:hypothetical protein
MQRPTLPHQVNCLHCLTHTRGAMTSLRKFRGSRWLDKHQSCIAPSVEAIDGCAEWGARMRFFSTTVLLECFPADLGWISTYYVVQRRRRLTIHATAMQGGQEWPCRRDEDQEEYGVVGRGAWCVVRGGLLFGPSTSITPRALWLRLDVRLWTGLAPHNCLPLSCCSNASALHPDPVKIAAPRPGRSLGCGVQARDSAPRRP